MSFLYNFVKYYGKIALPLYFGKVEINGRENIPSDSPFIYAPNHQNAFLDAIIIGVYSSKEVHFLTRSDVFVKPYIWLLNGLNMMPVYRIRDGYDKLKKNDETFDTCYSLLDNKKPVLIFSEGNMAGVHYLRPLTKGISRLSFQTQDRQEKDIYIVPVGINYFHHDHPRRKLILNFGRPIRVRDFIEIYQENKARGLISLRDRVFNQIADLLVLVSEEDVTSNKRYIFSRKYEHLAFHELKKKVSESTGFEKDKQYPWLKPLVHLLSLPNFAPLWLIYNIISKLKDNQFINSIKFTIGVFVLPLWWLLVFILASVAFSVKFGLVILWTSILSIFLKQYIRNLTR